MLKVLDLFSGSGMFSYGLEKTGGFETVAFCEIEPYARAVLKRHWPGAPIFEDVCKLEAEDVGPVDVICGGFPCQDISVAGRKAGIGGEQSGLWVEFARLIGEIRPRWVIVENSPNLLAGGNGQWFGRVLGDLAEVGYDAEWHCIPATAVGAPHNRDRVYIVAYPQRDEQPREEPRLWPVRRMGRVEQPVSWDTDWESALTVFRGMDDGNARVVDRTDLTRNAVVPQIPEMIGHAILKAEAAE